MQVFLACRSVDPTTSVVCSTQHTDSPHQGVLMFSSHSILLLQPADTQQATALLHLHLAGVPTAVAHVDKATWAVADSMADLRLVDLAGACTVQRVTAAVPLTIAHDLFKLPVPTSEPGSGRHWLPACDCCFLFLKNQSQMSVAVVLPTV